MLNKIFCITVMELLLIVSLSCALQPTEGQTEMVIGGVFGGTLESQVGGGSGKTAATNSGTVRGASIGGAVGRSMDEMDRLKIVVTLEIVRTGVSTTWRNPDTGSKYKVTPTLTYDRGAAQCREYTIEAVIGGRKEKFYGTACRTPDGNWQS